MGMPVIDDDRDGDPVEGISITNEPYDRGCDMMVSAIWQRPGTDSPTSSEGRKNRLGVCRLLSTHLGQSAAGACLGRGSPVACTPDALDGHLADIAESLTDELSDAVRALIAQRG